MAGAPISTPLWQFRSLENWAREVIIKELCPSGGAKVVQYGGGGFDIGKWERAGVSFLMNVDSQEEYSEQAEKRWISKGSPFFANFLTADFAYKFRLPAELSSEMGHFSLIMASDNTLERTSFKSLDHLNDTLQTASSLLSVGGHFVGFVWDSAELWRQSVEVTSSMRRQDDYASHSLHSPQLPSPETLSVKETFSVASGHIHFHIPHLSAVLAAENEKIDLLAPKPLNRYLGINFKISMEGYTESLHICHAETMMEVAKAHGFVCCSFRNLLDFYDTFKLREDEALRKLQVYAKTVTKLLPEQKEAASMMSIFVFRKSH